MAFKTGKFISQIQSLIFDMVDSMNEADPDDAAKAGSGTRTTNKLTPGDFDSIKIISATKVKVKVNVVVGDQSAVDIEIDDNLHGSLEVGITNRCLTIKNTDKYRSKAGLLVNIKTKHLHSISTQGEISTTVKNFKNNALSVHTAGLSELVMDGSVSAAKIQLDGSAPNINLSKLLAKEVDAKISGSGDVTLNVTERLHVTINGTGNVRYTGDPKTVKREIRGFGMVIPLENYN